MTESLKPSPYDQENKGLAQPGNFDPAAGDRTSPFPEPSKLRVLDLFSGIGGFSLGLEAAGMETVAFCEVSPVCRHLLAHHWPKVPCYDDVQTLTAERLAADGIGVDVICGGFPCQDLSYAGKGAGLAGARSGLWSEYARLIDEIRPLVVVVENVAALLGRGLGTVLGDLAALRYDAWWDCIPAVAIGAPHRRDRLWIIAYTRSQQHEGFGDAVRRAFAAQLSGATLADPDTGLHAGRLDSGADILASGGSEIGHGSEGEAPHRQRVRAEPRPGRTTVANADRQRQLQSQGGVRDKRRRPGNSGQVVADANRYDEHGRRGAVQVGRLGFAGEAAHHGLPGRDEWRSEPDVGRVAHGVPARVDRLHGLGNAVVPQIPKALGRAILEGLAA